MTATAAAVVVVLTVTGPSQIACRSWSGERGGGGVMIEVAASQESASCWLLCKVPLQIDRRPHWGVERRLFTDT